MGDYKIMRPWPRANYGAFDRCHGVFVLLVCLGERLRDWRPLLAEQFRKLRDIAPACLVQTA
jgi:hypothetical protein